MHPQPKQQTPVHLVAGRQTGTATSILRALLTAAGKDIRLKADGVSILFLENDILKITLFVVHGNIRIHVIHTKKKETKKKSGAKQKLPFTSVLLITKCRE